MEKIKQFFEEKLAPTLIKVNNSIFIKTIMSAFMKMLPLTIAGAFAALLSNLPLEPLQVFLTDSGLRYYLSLPITFTTQFMAVIMSLTIPYSYLQHKQNNSMMGGALLGMVAFLIMTPATLSTDMLGAEAVTLVLGQISYFGTMGIFAAIIIGFIVAKVFDVFITKGITIKMPESVPPFIANAFANMVPGLVIIVGAIIVAYLFGLTPFGSIHNLVYGLVQVPLSGLGGTLGAMLIVAILSQVLWFFGIHGSMAVLSVMMPIWMSLDAANLAAYQANAEIPNIVSMVFFSIYTPGGFGICTAILLFISKSKRYKLLGRLSIVPATFNITEPVIFGTPLVMNSIFFIPFVFSNVISLIIAYVLTVMGIVPIPVIGAPTGTPIIIGALIAGGWKVAALQATLIVLITLFWLPFIKYADKKELELEKASVNSDVVEQVQ
ncbi:MAG: PTS sugar transporter subunit IIC [Erysipelotrichaceae bacterium]